jgi:hypothetical protein
VLNDIVVVGMEVQKTYKTYGHSGHIFRSRFFQIPPLQRMYCAITQTQASPQSSAQQQA